MKKKRLMKCSSSSKAQAVMRISSEPVGLARLRSKRWPKSSSCSFIRKSSLGNSAGRDRHAVATSHRAPSVARASTASLIEHAQEHSVELQQSASRVTTERNKGK